jgi:uncharacterized protein (DUF1800 family)
LIPGIGLDGTPGRNGAMSATRHIVAGLALAGSAVAFGAEPTGTAVEYFNTGLGHYFVTADPLEMSSVESGGAGPGWQRTGGEFSVFRAASDAPGLSPVCRFYGTPGVGPNSHFYTADPAECESVKQSVGWTYEGIAFYIAVPQSGQCAAGTTPVFRSYNNGYVRNDSNHRFTVDPTVFAHSASFGYEAEGVAMCAPLSQADLQADAVRLLRQAAFGPSEAEAARATSMGAAAWIDTQLAMPGTQYPDYPWVPTQKDTTCTGNCARDGYSLFPLQLQFFANAVTQPDQLRGRVAFALSQIFVTSGVSNARNYAMRDYQQLLADHAFGNFHDLLLAVTLSPNMGDYLDMANNNKANPANGTQPNENYGREILQLFSVGTVLLNPDGTPMLDASGRAIDTYDQGVIEGFSHVFTGWTYAPAAGAPSRNNNPKNYLGTMLAVDANHDFGPKPLLAGVIAPPGQSMQEDLELAHQVIVGHANVGPFIGKQLIQKLVTSDPTPAYVARISAVWNDNGAGQRGDLRAVVRAILTDPEARGARKIDPAYGKLVEPAVYLASLLRATNGTTDGVYLRAQSSNLAQNVFYAPSVFNFYSPAYQVPETALVGPEFQLFTSATALGRANVVNALVFGTIGPDPTVVGSTGTHLDLSPYVAVAGDAGALVDRANAYLLGGTMPAAMRATILTAVNAVPASDVTSRARTALYLVFSSVQYQVQR